MKLNKAEILGLLAADQQVTNLQQQLNAATQQRIEVYTVLGLVPDKNYSVDSTSGEVTGMDIEPTVSLNRAQRQKNNARDPA